MNPSLRALVMPGVVTAIMFAALVSLGLWQLRRLDEKEALLARVERGYNEAPSNLPPRADWSTLPPQDYEYRHVKLSGHYDSGKEALIYAIAPEGFGNEPGFNVVTPFRLAEGGVILVERGFLPQSKINSSAGRAPPEGEQTIAGHLRAPQSRNSFTPPDQPSRGIFYTRDPAAMAAAMGVADAAPFSLALDAPAQANGEGPRPIPDKPEFPNNHLSYALTWFGLALADIVIFVLYARGVLARER